MKKFSLFTIFALMLAVYSASFTSATDTQLEDQFTEYTVTAQDLKFKQVSSCESLDEVLSKYTEKYKWYYNNYPMYARWWMLEGGMIMEDAVAESSDSSKSTTNEWVGSSSNDFSQTNNQKVGVDEPDIIKTDGEYIYYYNTKTSKIYIIKSPLDVDISTINLDDAEIIQDISIPQGLYNINIFLSEDRLSIIWTKYIDRLARNESFIQSSNRTIVAIYDVSDVENLDLIKFQNIQGYYSDARLIDDNLYVITNEEFNRYYWKENSTIDDSINSVEITDESQSVDTLDCEKISYVLPDQSEDEDSNYNIRPQFTIINAIDTKNISQKSEMTVLLSDAGSIHMSQDSLYIISSLYTPMNWSCPVWAMCIMPRFFGTTQSLIHKFTRDDLKFDYVNSNVVPWNRLSQYSMDEDKNWNFRILTTIWKNEISTNLYLLDKDLELQWKLENIEPGEQFKSSRYIWDKLYLVTFKQIDPLFVVDLEDTNNPEILWELKIPGYSTYLHPLKEEDDNKQYLVGLWYDTATWSRGGMVNSWVKLSLYEIDYNISSEDGISIQELSTITQWWEGSNSEVLNNPRLFVMDKEGNVTLPLNLSQSNLVWNRCNIIYDKNGAETDKNCYPQYKQENTFVGLKTFSISEENWIEEIFAKNYIPKLSSYLNNVYDNTWSMRYINMRVGFAWDVLYMFNDYFADFVLPKNYENKTIELE